MFLDVIIHGVYLECNRSVCATQRVGKSNVLDFVPLLLHRGSYHFLTRTVRRVNAHLLAMDLGIEAKLGLAQQFQHHVHERDKLIIIFELACLRIELIKATLGIICPRHCAEIYRTSDYHGNDEIK